MLKSAKGRVVSRRHTGRNSQDRSGAVRPVLREFRKIIGLPAVALLGMLAMAPHQASAAVRFGVVIGRPAVYAVCPPVPVVVAPAPVVVARPWVAPVIRWDRRHDFRFRR